MPWNNYQGLRVQFFVRFCPVIMLIKLTSCYHLVIIPLPQRQSPFQKKVVLIKHLKAFENHVFFYHSIAFNVIKKGL
jgi:hypothetical protein